MRVSRLSCNAERSPFESGRIRRSGAWLYPTFRRSVADMRRYLLIVFALTLCVRAEASGAPDRRVDRLAHLAKVWGTVRWLHPHMFLKEIDWDGALVAAISAVNAADTDDEYAVAVDRMLSTLHDPLTHVVAKVDASAGAVPSSNRAERKEGGQRRPLFEQRDDLVIVSAITTEPTQPEHHGLQEALRKSKRVIVDLRFSENDGDVTALVLSGGITITFSGHDVRHIDGRPLQRFGLVPDVPAVPTIAGIRAGKDEVLDRAIDYLSR